MKYFAFLIFSLFTLLLVKAQSSQKITFDKETIILNPQARGFEEVYRVNADTLFYRGEGTLVKYPKNFNCKDTGYFFSYFTGCPDAILNRQQLVIIENYKSDKPRFWVDQNGNFDISDDGPPTELSDSNDLILYFKNCANPEGVFPVRFFRSNWDSTTTANLSKNYGKPGQQKNGQYKAEIKYWFASQRKDIKFFKGKINTQEVRLGLHDSNCDGLYTRNGRDKLLISKKAQQQMSNRVVHGAVLLKDTCFFFINEQAYELLEVDSIGNHIVIKPSKVDFEAPIVIGDILKNYKVPFKDGSKDLITCFKGKPYLLIDVWGSWCGGCVQQAPGLKELFQKHSDHLNIIGLNHGDTPQSKAKFEEKFQIPWESGTLSEEIKNDLNIEGFPSYLLVSEELELLMYDSHPFYILEFLEAKTKDN